MSDDQMSDDQELRDEMSAAGRFDAPCRHVKAGVKEAEARRGMDDWAEGCLSWP